ncbi:tetratricopeptide repeat protein [Edaphobacter bradus]|uniref:tetratricopeptide repeat protein n=1 Tax=Edaphobacter bradus TaxID=2259016 RepID=UPI0021DFC463|nr:tetratricopeptide repeat protein [Edaphobacter bradus]
MSVKSVFFTGLLFVLPVSCVCQSTQSKSGQIHLHESKAQQYLRQQRPDLAIPEFNAILALDPANTDAQGNLGVLLFFRGDSAGAVPHLRAAVNSNPELWKLQALLGLAEARQSDAGSRADLEAAFPHLKGEKVQAEVGSALIDSYTANGELEKAAGTVATLLESQPTDVKLLAMSYRLYSDLAGRTMLTLALTDPNSAQLHQVMARELARQGDDAGAIKNYREAIRIDPKVTGLYFELGDILYSSSDEKLKAEAEGEFRAAVAANPNDEKAQLMLGKIAAARGDMKTAYDNDSHALELQPNDGDACTEFAKVLLSMKERGRAQQMLEHAVEVDPTNYVAHYRLSTLYRQQGRPEEAKKELAEYQKYKDMKEKLRTVFHDMRVNLDEKADEDAGMSK